MKYIYQGLHVCCIGGVIGCLVCSVFDVGDPLKAFILGIAFLFCAGITSEEVRK